MSKTSQRKKQEDRNRQKRFEEGAKSARKNKELPEWYYPNCMAWRAGWLSEGGEKFWKWEEPTPWWKKALAG